MLEALSRHSRRHIDKEEERKRIALKELLPEFADEPVVPYDRQKREELIRKKCLNKGFTEDFNIMLLYAFEGFGKSYYAYLLAKEKNKPVLFASISNEQAAEQAEGFRKLGLRVQFIPGREYVLRQQYNVEIQYQEPTHPWDIDRLAKGPTKRWMKGNQKRTAAEIEQIWTETESPRPDFENHDIVCTTIARTMAYGRMQKDRYMKVWKKDEDGEKSYDWMVKDPIIPSHVVVFFDDPDKESFTWYKPYNAKLVERLQKRQQEQREKRREESAEEQPDPDDSSEHVIPPSIHVDGESIKIEKINGRDYFVRPRSMVLGFGLRGNPLVFTTTEELTRRLIHYMYERWVRKKGVERLVGVYEPGLMPEQQMNAGDITMIKTNIVASKRDGFLPPIVHRLQSEGFDFNYIADGQGSTINLVNNKGQNIFADKDSVIEISEPHFEIVTRFIDELHDHGWQESDRNALKVVLALDALQQAIGRNSGYRWSDRETRDQRRCIVLCDPRLHNTLIRSMRYYVGTRIDNVNDRVGARKDYTTLQDGLCWFIRNLDSYLRNGIGNRGQAFWDDVSAVLTSLAPNRRRSFQKRLLSALKAKIKEASDTRLSEKLGGYAAQLGD